MLRQFGYLDPGTGSLFLQAVIGVILGSIVFFRNFFIKLFKNIKSLFSRKSFADEDKPGKN